MPDYFVESLFKDRMPDAAKLRAFGFSPAGGKYLYSTDIMDGQFRMCVTVARNGEVGARLVEISFNEEYSLHLVSSAGGQFVGRVKEEYGRVLADISEKCFERNIFKSAVAKKVIAYVRKKYGDEPEYLWEKFPSNAVFRRKDNRKWYGAILTVQKNRLGPEGEERVEIVDLRIDGARIDSIVDGKKYFPGYHMNKRHWFTMILDGSVPAREIFRRIDESYEIAAKRS